MLFKTLLLYTNYYSFILRPKSLTKWLRRYYRRVQHDWEGVVLLGPLEAMPSQYATFITLDDASDHPHTRHLEHGAQALILQSLSRFLNSFIDLVLFPTHQDNARNRLGCSVQHHDCQRSPKGGKLPSIGWACLTTEEFVKCHRGYNIPILGYK